MADSWVVLVYSIYEMSIKDCKCVIKKYVYEIEWLNNRIKELEEEKDFFYRSAQQFRNENEELKKKLDKLRTDNIYEEWLYG